MDNDIISTTKYPKNNKNDEHVRIDELKIDLKLVEIGKIETIFNKKNGTPRQSGVCPLSKGIIHLNKQLFNNPNHALEGIEQFKYIWIIYYFHKNTNKRRFIAKVRPPRLNGASCGVLASRSPHRPNPLGMTLAKIDCVKDGQLHVSGIDIIDGTPIIDLKPYIEKYDYPLINLNKTPMDLDLSNLEENDQQKNIDEPLTFKNEIVKIPTNYDGWINGSIVSDITVQFTERSLKQLSQFHLSDAFHSIDESECNHCFRLFQNHFEAKQAITDLLRADPRSVYRRTKCIDRLYFFTIDAIHITAWFDIIDNMVEVIKIKPFIVNNCNEIKNISH